MANVGTTFSAASLAKFLKSEQRTVAPETILNYIKYCCDAYLFYQVKREELLRRGYEVTVGRIGDKEIDFVCHKRNDKLYIQVTYLPASDETIQREFGAYDNIRDNFPKYVVSLDEFDMSRNGIKHRNIRDFLLAKEWN